MKYIKVEIRMSELHTQGRVVAPWEVPVLKAAQKAGVVTVVGSEEVDAQAPEAADEYQRLSTRYKQKTEAPPFVSQVYGLHEEGIAKLEKEIQRAVKADEMAKAKSSDGKGGGTQQPGA